MERRLPRGLRSSLRAVALALAAVVLSSVASSLYAQKRLADDTEAIVTLARYVTPALRRLAGARAEVLHLSRLTARGHAPAAELAASRDRLGRALRAYEAVPFLPGERAAYAPVPPALARVDALLSRGATTGEAGVELERLFERIEAALEEVVEINLVSLRRHALADARRRAVVVSAGLAGLNLALAAFAAWLALRTMRRYLRVVGRHGLELEHFAMQVAHELGNPLTTIAVALDLASRRVHDEALQQPFARTRRSLERMKRELDRLAALVEAGRPRDPGGGTSLAAALDRALGTPPPEDVVVPAFADVVVACEAERLADLLGVLVDHARRRAAGRAPVVVHVRPARSSVLVEVEDHGPPPARDVMEAFAPPLRDPVSAAPGIDLELARARRILEAEDSHYAVRRRGGRTVFCVRLALTRPAAAR